MHETRGSRLSTIKSLKTNHSRREKSHLLSSLLTSLCQLFCQLAQARVIWKEQPQLKRCFPQIIYRHAYGAFSLLMMDVGGTSSLNGATPGQVVLGYKRKQTEQALESKPMSSTHLWSLLELLPPGTSRFWLVNQIDVILPKMIFVVTCYHSNRAN